MVSFKGGERRGGLGASKIPGPPFAWPAGARDCSCSEGNSFLGAFASVDGKRLHDLPAKPKGHTTFILLAAVPGLSHVAAVVSFSSLMTGKPRGIQLLLKGSPLYF